MTDEELGRAWCGATHKFPHRGTGGDGTAYWYWFPSGGLTGDGPHRLPPALSTAASMFAAEADAYAAVGAALRAVWAFADESRGAVAGTSSSR